MESGVGTKAGLGTLKYANGYVHYGEFKNDLFKGRGAYAYAGGAVYEGDWDNGVRLGRGVMKYINGDVFKGSSDLAYSRVEEFILRLMVWSMMVNGNADRTKEGEF